MQGGVGGQLGDAQPDVVDEVATTPGGERVVDEASDGRDARGLRDHAHARLGDLTANRRDHRVIIDPSVPFRQPIRAVSQALTVSDSSMAAFHSRFDARQPSSSLPSRQ